MYVSYQKKGETGKEYTQEIDLDLEAAELAWPNFKTFFTRFKDHPALGPGAVDDSAVTLPSVAAEVVVPDVSRKTMIATLRKLPDVQVGHRIRVPLLVLVMMTTMKIRRCQIPQKRTKEKKHPLLPGLAKRRGDRQEQLSSWLPLERCRRMHR